ncbi:MAG: hypothetical protein AEth_01780 [Candidatus Argoarchaeum ethanivorans]|uniref:Peptidase C39-like domain-containing protein n=1 Tax=Candidatus Argoarchaeum ethanivorans TaxID=2608793 RepID=A0A8B3S0F4_9EURY|nr:MAG: hypothetical protein AEth_01780 [Candidatus Argoarchaeum ethanivorans]
MKSGKVKGKNIKVRRHIFAIVGIALLVTLIMPATVLADIEEHPYLVKTFIDEEGRKIAEIIVPGLPPEKRISEAVVSDIEIRQADATLSDVPAFDWCYGCSATSAAMMFGYYDRTGYSNMYAGPANGGVCPLTNSVWGVEECPLSATHQGYDGLAVKGHVDDYWSFFGSNIDPYCNYVPPWSEHMYADCTADYMGTNQHYNWQNSDGGTTFCYYVSGAPLYDYSECEPGKRDGCHGIRLFVESRGYNVHHDGSNHQNYNQCIDPYVAGGFTFDDFKAEIDAGRPVIIHVDGHSMLGYGYDDPITIHIHDTWGHSSHSMTWGGYYDGRQHYGVTVIQLQSLPVITSCDPSSTETSQFTPSQSVYVKGSGLEPNTDYNIWIQNDPVAEGKTLAIGEDPSGAQEAVTTGPGNGNPSGGFPATEIWPIPQSEPVTHHPYDIVVDKVGGGEGTYNSNDDGIDSVAVVGFVAPVPELPTIILFSMGLVVLVGYVVLRRRK